MTRLIVHATLLVLAAAGSARGQPNAAPDVPTEIAAVLAQHLGKWRSDATLVTNGTTITGTAAWECTAALDGVGLICTWLHEWPGGASDRAVELVGYDPASGKLSFARVTDRGIASASTVDVRGDTLVGVWTETQDGKTVVGRNEIHLRPGDGGDWTQRILVEVGGETVTEMRITHRRVP